MTPPIATIAPGEDVLWMLAARKLVGTPEKVQGQLNPVVRELFKSTRYPLDKLTPDTPWCAAFVCACLERSGVPSTRSAAASSYLDWGEPLRELVHGCVVVLRRGLGGGKLMYHVAFGFRPHDAEHIDVLGGNQDNTVNVKTRALDDVIAMRWPAGVPFPAGA